MLENSATVDQASGLRRLARAANTNGRNGRRNLMEDAISLRNAIPPDCFDRWIVAGSLRRKKVLPSDVDHVVLPRRSGIDSGLFDATPSVNLLWKRVDELLAMETIARWNYPPDGGHRWGEKMRGLEFRGVKHEIFCAAPENLGYVLLIRTGPSDFSRAFVTALRHNGLLGKDGFIWDDAGKIVACPDEETAFGLVGWKYLEPEARS